MDLSDVIKDKRPNLSASSLKTYKSILMNLYRKCYPADDEIILKKFENTESILNHLREVPYNKRKTTLAALVVLTGNLEYTKLMNDDIHEYNKNKVLQKQDGKFDNMLTTKDVEDIFKKIENDAKHMFKSTTHSMADLQKIQNYVLLALTSGLFQAPRRSLDWVMKFRSFDVDKDNYVDLKRKEFVFNVFKTRKDKGQQRIEISKPLLAILKKWIGILPTDMDYLLFDGKRNAISPSQITHRLNSIFKKNISTSMLRHIYLTSRFSTINLKDLIDTSESMGNSPMQSLEYVKNK